MRLISWNVNGIRAAMRKGFNEFFEQVNADMFCVQETKMQPGQAVIETPGYHQYWNSADRKGYSGTAIFTKEEPLGVQYDFGQDEHHHEGRGITLEFPCFYLVNLYSPNAQNELARIDYRLRWQDALKEHIASLLERNQVIICGDMNVARSELDLYDPEQYAGSTGFSDQERNAMEELLGAGLVDTFRHLHPDERGYTWWSYMRSSRLRNAGWRIDYFLVSQGLVDKVRDSVIYPEVTGSDHCPIGIEIC